MKFKVIAIFLLVSITFFGCKKKKEVQIVGTWIEIPPTEQPDTYETKWIFTEDNVLEILSYETVIVSGEYTLSYKFPNFYIDIPELELVQKSGLGGRYRIDDLDELFLYNTQA